MMYKPLRVFGIWGAVMFLCGFAIGLRFLWFYMTGDGSGHIQSLILSALLILLGFQTGIVGMQADIIASNRKIMEDIQYRVRKMECGMDVELEDLLRSEDNEK